MTKMMDKRVIRILSMVLLMVMLFTTAAFATGPTEDLEEGVKGGLSQLYDLLRNGAIWIAVIVLAIAGIALIVSSQNGFDKAKNTLGRVFIGIALVFLAGFIVTEVAGWFVNVGDAGVFN